MILSVLTFGVFFALIWGAYWVLVLRPEQAEAGAFAGRLKTDKAVSKVQQQIERKSKRRSSIRAVDALLTRGDATTESLQLLITQSGVRIPLATLLFASAVLAVLTFVVLLRLFVAVGDTVVMVPLALAGAALVAFVPIALLKFMRSRRLRKFEEQFPEALDLLSRALRAGHAFTTGIEMVADELPEPVGPEFRLLYDQQNYGMAMPEALRLFAERVMLLDARFFVTAVLIQRESGGNLAEVLDKLAGVVRDRHKVKRQMRVVSAHGRITGWILVCLPPVLFLVMMVLDADYRVIMFGTPLGVRMLWGALGLQIVGTLIIRQIINPEY